MMAPKTKKPTLPGSVRSEFRKLRHTPMLKAHLAISIGIALVFLAYYSVSIASPQMKVEAYFQVLGVGLPFLAGLFGGLASEQERQAGHLSNLLCMVSRRTPLLGKLIAYLLLCFGALLIAFVVFAIGMAGLGQNTLPLTAYLEGAVLALAGSVVLYIASFLIAFVFGRNAAIGFGIVGSLVGALMLTGLGDGLWPFVPFAWPTHFASAIAASGRLPEGAIDGFATASLASEFNASLLVCAIATGACIIGFCLWTSRFEGRPSDG